MVAVDVAYKDRLVGGGTRWQRSKHGQHRGDDKQRKSEHGAADEMGAAAH
jgi:hypothetical protein